MATSTSKYTSTRTYTIRSGRLDDIPFLADIERSAGQLFRTVGLDSVADDEPMPPEVLMSYLEAENLWVATTSSPRSERQGEEEVVVAFLSAFPITITASPQSKCTSKTTPASTSTPSSSPPPSSTSPTKTLLHIAELSVHSSHHRQGLGRRLLTHFEQCASSPPPSPRSPARSEILGLSLTTYRDLPFNGPFYAKLGFQEVPAQEIEFVVGKRGRELWDEEQAKIARRERRCWMVKWLC